MVLNQKFFVVLITAIVVAAVFGAPTGLSLVPAADLVPVVVSQTSVPPIARTP